MTADQLENEITALKAQLREAVRLLIAGPSIKTIEQLNQIESDTTAFLAQHADIVAELGK